MQNIYVNFEQKMYICTYFIVLISYGFRQLTNSLQKVKARFVVVLLYCCLLLLKWMLYVIFCINSYL